MRLAGKKKVDKGETKSPTIPAQLLEHFDAAVQKPSPKVLRSRV